MSNQITVETHSAKKVSYKNYVSRNSPWYGVAEFWAYEPMDRREWNPKLLKTMVFGLLSGLLYFILFEYEGELRHFAVLTQEGEKIDFLIPIIIAFVFSLVHGTFTGYFWDLLGVTPRQIFKDTSGVEGAEHGSA